MVDWPVILTAVAMLVAVVCVGLIWLQTHDARWRARYAAWIASRERAMVGMIADSVGLYRDGLDEKAEPRIVVGQSALSTRYFGGLLPDTRSRLELHESDRYATLCQLARREAVVQMLEAAHAAGFNAVCNVQIDSADVGHTLNRAQRAMVIVTATGTAYRVG
jgi:uncharacterized protein YbjQ (UPF0145 family)